MKPENVSPSMTSGDVMVVDDKLENLRIIEVLLKEQGYKVRCIPDAKTALEVAANKPPEIMLLDVLMPGMSGYELCAALKARPETKGFPIIFLTALTEMENLVEGFNSGGVAFLSKPVRPEEMLAHVKTHIELYRARKEIEKHKELLEKRVAERTAELLHLRNYLFNIVNSMPSVLVGVDVDGKVTQWNAAAEKTTGIAAADAQGMMLSDVFPEMASEMGKITESIQTRETKQELKKIRQSTGDICFEDITIFPLIANGVEGAVIRIDDVSEKVRMEEVLIQSEKMLSIGGLAAGMAHEINNPLAAVMQNANNMARRFDMDANIPDNLKAAEAAGVSMEAIHDYMEARDIPRMIKDINKSGHRVIGVMNNMLSFSQKSDAIISECSLEKLLDKTLELAASDYDLKKHYDFKKIDIKKEYEDNVPLIPCEPLKIQQVLLNILRNGAQIMQEAGTEHPQLIVRLRFEKQIAIIEIEDNGPGMDEETRKRVFEPFYTTKPKGVGTGLGLSVSYFIITSNHNGEMSVESTPGTGAKFIIRLPVDGKTTPTAL